MESKKVIKFFSYTKKILAMSFFSLILSISLSNKNLFAIDRVNLQVGNGTTYKLDDKSKVSYELNADNTFSAVVGDEGETVYSRASYKNSDGKDTEVPVTSISANSGVSAFTVKLVDPKSDKIKINPSEDSSLTVKLEYDGSLSQAETRKIFGNDVDVGMNQGKADRLTIKKPVSPEDSSEPYDYEYGSDGSIASTDNESNPKDADGSIESTDKTNSNNEKSSSNASSSSSNTNSSSASSSSNTTTSGYTTSAGTNSSTSKTASSSTSTQTTKASSSSAKSSNSSKSSSSATKSASTKTSDASLIPLSILACSGASVLLLKKKD